MHRFILIFRYYQNPIADLLLLDYYLLGTKNMLDEAVSVTNDALKKGVKLEQINDTTVKGLRAAFKQAGREFPFAVKNLIYFLC